MKMEISDKDKKNNDHGIIGRDKGRGRGGYRGYGRGRESSNLSH